MRALFITQAGPHGDQVYRFYVESDHINNHACDLCGGKETAPLTDFRINCIQNDRSNLYVSPDTKLGREIAQRFADLIPPSKILCYGCFLTKTKPWQAG